MKLRTSTVTSLFLLVFILFVIPLGYVGCQKDPTSIIPDHESRQNPDYIPEGCWIKCSPYKWTHDGEPYFGEYCIVYSDCCSYQFKQEVGIFADEKFVQILDLFNFKDMNDLLYPMDYKKVDVYINRYHPERFAAAWWGTIIISFSSEYLHSSRHAYLFKHELTHVFQFLIEGHYNLSTPVWFTEGIAIYGGGGLWGIETIDDLDRWIANNSNDPNKGNPIFIEVWDDFPVGADITGYYVNVFDLTMRYFLDPDGLNKSIEDVLSLFYDLRNSIPFATALQTHFGLDVETFQNEYYERMRDYLEGGTIAQRIDLNDHSLVKILNPILQIPYTSELTSYQK